MLLGGAAAWPLGAAWRGRANLFRRFQGTTQLLPQLTFVHSVWSRTWHLFAIRRAGKQPCPDGIAFSRVGKQPCPDGRRSRISSFKTSSARRYANNTSRQKNCHISCSSYFWK